MLELSVRKERGFPKHANFHESKSRSIFFREDGHVSMSKQRSKPKVEMCKVTWRFNELELLTETNQTGRSI